MLACANVSGNREWYPRLDQISLDMWSKPLDIAARFSRL